MILAGLNQQAVVFQVYTLNPDGSEKTNVSSATVRVYEVVSGSEIDVLPEVAMVQVSPPKWRYRWAPATLDVGEYLIEYLLEDSDGMVSILGEDLIVRDIAIQDTLTDVRSRVILLQGDLTIVRKVETGRWRIHNDQMTFYDDDEVTPLLVFDLKDDAGLPSSTRVFERVPE